MQTPHREDPGHLAGESNPGPPCCEATVLPTAPPCCQISKYFIFKNMQAPLPFCTYLLLMLSCFVCVLPANGFFVINCVIKGSLKYPANLKAIISGGSFQNLFNLTVLRLDENQITNISASAFDPLISLVMVNLSGNHLAHIHEVQPLFQLLNIQELHIGRNGFSSFQTPQVSNTSLKLRVLDLSWNPLRVFRITADVFPHLESLGLAFSNESMTWDVQDASYLRNVSTLNLTGIEMNEEIKSVLQTFNTSLTNLSLYRLKEKILIKTACLINTLRTLHVQSSRLASISAKELIGCTDLVTLDLSENSLRNITNLAFGFMTSLKRLNLSYNSIYNLTSCLQKLEFLDLTQNKLNYIHKEDFLDLKSLKHLLLNDNQITTIDKGASEGLQKLTVLNLQSNKITQSSLKASVFSGLTNLKYLLLNNNYLSYSDQSSLVKPPFRYLKSLETLAIHSQGHKGMLNVPSNFLEGLTSLQVLTAGNLNLNFLYPNTFSHTPRLLSLDRSHRNYSHPSKDSTDSICSLLVCSLWTSSCKQTSLRFNTCKSARMNWQLSMRPSLHHLPT
uniref:LRRCT domain-containing protein n=1 Tax=Pygocentrus nattereri TaxID=42514 RepID=A0AAR2KIX6_PYGNA